MKPYPVLTDRQREIVNFIRNSIKKNGYPPSVREIGEAVGLSSISTVHAHLVTLEELGILKRDPMKPRSVIPVGDEGPGTVGIPVVGNVAAGTPILAEENIESYMSVPVDLIGYGVHFILKVKGDSMIEAGILDGDYLIIRQQPSAENGEIVVAILEDEATVKRFYKKQGSIELRPENSTMEPIITDCVQIAGKVCGLFRRI